MPSPRYFGVIQLWRFGLALCLIVNLPQLLPFLWNPSFVLTKSKLGVVAISLQFLTSFAFGLLFALLYVDLHNPVSHWYQRRGKYAKFAIQAVLLLLLTELFFQIQLLIPVPNQDLSFYYLTYLVRHIVIAVAIWGFWHFITIVHESNRVSIENEQLKRLKVKNQLEALSNQLNPHFLFNALNILNVSITTDPRGAQQIVHNLSDILRYNLKIQNQNLVRLADELAVAYAYLDLYKARFGDKLVFTFETLTTKKGWYIVPLSLQILIENAIKHNVITSNSILHIKVMVNEEEGQLMVINSINRKPQAESLGIGLTNLGKRYQLITGKKTAQTDNAEQFTVTIPLIESP